MLREARIIFPHIDKDGNILPERIEYRFREWIIDKFGGCTVSYGDGYWRNPKNGKQYAETVSIVDIAAAPTLENMITLRDIATTFCKAGNQECVYLRHLTGIVEFVS